MLNTKKGLQYCDGEVDMYLFSMDVYLRKYEAQLTAIQDALTAQNWKALTTAAHSMKTNGLWLGAEELENCSRELEQVGRQLWNDADGKACLADEEKLTLIKEANALQEVIRGTAADVAEAIPTVQASL